MCWGVLAAVIVSEYASKGWAYQAPEPDLEQQIREHRARVAAETRKTLRDAKIGAFLMLALLAVAAIGIGQLCGVIPVI